MKETSKQNKSYLCCQLNFKIFEINVEQFVYI